MAPPSDRQPDARFSRLNTDPRYRLPGKKNARVAVDSRFNRLFSAQDEDFSRRAKVDKFGRKISRSGDRAAEVETLGRLYRAADEEEEDEEDASEEDEEIEQREERSKGKSKQSKSPARLAPASSDEEEEEDSDSVDGDAQVSAELARVGAKYDPARDGGFSESSSEDDSSSDEEEEDAVLPEDEDEDGQSAAAAVPMGDASSRLALVNLDWDNIRAADILAVASSFVPAGDGDRIESVAIYPSEFGKERMEREELDGPPREIFTASTKRKSRRRGDDDEDKDDGSDEDDEQIRKKLQSADAGEEFDSDALRRYQLDRLRYFYAVLTCSSADVAQSIYTALDGREYLTTANFFDLRFIPDGVSFDDDKPREVANRLDKGYKPNDFVTDALTHSKVKLTWDAEDGRRKEVQKRAFSRKEVDENDLRAYIGGSSSEEEDEAAGEDDKKSAERNKMRALLGLGADNKEKKGERVDRHVGDMQVTFTSGLSAKDNRGVFENSPPRDETTRERYVRKEKERKAKRREKAKAKRDGTEGGESSAASDNSDVEGITSAAPVSAVAEGDASADPFDDPFFNDGPDAPPSKSQKDKQRKADRIAKREAKAAAREKADEQRRQLEGLMEAEGDGTVQHFDMKEMKKAAKLKKKAGKKGKKAAAEEEAADDKGQTGAAGEIETADPRFTRMFESHEYAIDPTNPRFQKTEGMQRILEEGRKRRRDGAVGVEKHREEKRVKQTSETQGAQDDDTQRLLARVKAKAQKSKR